MASIELVEKLREKANVSYEDAKAALTACNDDLLEALIMLEKQGKVATPPGGSYTSRSAPPENNLVLVPQREEKKRESFTQMLNRFFRWCGNMISRGNSNYFEVWRGENKILNVPITVLVLMLLFAFWVTIPLLIIGLFFSCKYQFKGRDVEKIDMNSVMDSAASAADTLKNEVKNAACKDHNNQ